MSASMEKTLLFKNDTVKQVNIKYEDERLSITADGYELQNNRWRDSFGGQSYDELLECFPKSARLVEIWKRWHLNDMNAGDEVQEAFLRAHGRGKDYKETCDILDQAGLLEHDGYKYGTAWKFEAVPKDIIIELKRMKDQ